VAGVVLAGGRSRRMGTDKAALVVDGRRLGDRSVDALRGAGIVRVVVVGGADRLDAEHLPDDEADLGPLGGLATAFAHLPAHELVVLPCDLPNVDAPAVQELLAGATAAPEADVVVARVDGRRAFPIGVWRRSVEPALVAALAEGERAVRRAIRSCRVVDVPGGPALRDADLPAELPRTGSLPDGPGQGGSM
jgi:molybdopterin-guanine dinucleotide biosynthesis protein A